MSASVSVLMCAGVCALLCRKAGDSLIQREGKRRGIEPLCHYICVCSAVCVRLGVCVGISMSIVKDY